MIKNKKIHILFIIENLSFPFDKRVFSEAKSLIKNGYFISVISPKGVKFDKDNYEVVEKIQVYRYGIKNNFNRIIGYVYEYFISYYNIMRLLIKIKIGRASCRERV